MTPAPAVAAKLWRALRPLLVPLLITVGYLVMHSVLARATAGYGLLAPAGSLHAPTVVLGLIVLAWKLVVIFVVPTWLVYRLLDTRLAWLSRQRK